MGRHSYFLFVWLSFQFFQISQSGPCPLPPLFSLSLNSFFFFFFSFISLKETRKIKEEVRSNLSSRDSREWLIDWLIDWSTERSPFYASWIVTYLSGACFGWGRSSSSSSPPRRRAFSFFSVLYCLELSVVYSRLYYNKLLWFLVILTFLDPSVYRF